MTVLSNRLNGKVCTVNDYRLVNTTGFDLW